MVRKREALIEDAIFHLMTCFRRCGTCLVCLGLVLPLIPSSDGHLPLIFAIRPDSFHAEHDTHAHDGELGNAAPATAPNVSSDDSSSGTTGRLRATLPMMQMRAGGE
jgi:hypothetical protein